MRVLTQDTRPALPCQDGYAFKPLITREFLIFLPAREGGAIVAPGALPWRVSVSPWPAPAGSDRAWRAGPWRREPSWSASPAGIPAGRRGRTALPRRAPTPP